MSYKIICKREILNISLRLFCKYLHFCSPLFLCNHLTKSAYIWFQSSRGSTLDDTSEYLKALKHPCQVSLFQLLLTFSLLSLSLHGDSLIDISFGCADFVCVSWKLDDVYWWRSSMQSTIYATNWNPNHTNSPISTGYANATNARICHGNDEHVLLNRP